MKKLLVVASNSVHTYNFLQLVEGYFDEVLLLTNSVSENYAGKSVVLNFSLKNPIRSAATVPRIKKIIKEFQPSLIHIQQANSAALLTLRAANSFPVKKVLTAWGSDILVNPKKGFLYRKMVEQILERADYFTADAQYLGAKMIAISKKKINISIINFGIEPICKNENELNDLISKKENIIYSNRLHKKLYRIDKIISAFSAFLKKNSTVQWRLVVAASGTETELLKKQAEESGAASHITFVGWINASENAEWCRKAKIFVSYPQSDATSVSLLEAMSAGCIPVLSDLPANREWVTSFENGMLSKNLSASDFENAMLLLNRNAAKQNLKIILNKATKDISRKLFFELYDHALSHS